MHSDTRHSLFTYGCFPSDVGCARPSHGLCSGPRSSGWMRRGVTTTRVQLIDPGLCANNLNWKATRCRGAKFAYATMFELSERNYLPLNRPT